MFGDILIYLSVLPPAGSSHVYRLVCYCKVIRVKLVNIFRYLILELKKNKLYWVRKLKVLVKEQKDTVWQLRETVSRIGIKWNKKKLQEAWGLLEKYQNKVFDWSHSRRSSLGDERLAGDANWLILQQTEAVRKLVTVTASLTDPVHSLNPDLERSLKTHSHAHINI